MLLVFSFLDLTGIYFSLVSEQHDILYVGGGEGMEFFMVVMEIFTGSRLEYVSLKGKLHLSKIRLDSVLLAGNSYLLLISPKYS